MNMYGFSFLGETCARVQVVSELLRLDVGASNSVSSLLHNWFALSVLVINDTPCGVALCSKVASLDDAD